MLPFSSHVDLRTSARFPIYKAAIHMLLTLPRDTLVILAWVVCSGISYMHSFLFARISRQLQVPFHCEKSEISPKAAHILLERY